MFFHPVKVPSKVYSILFKVLSAHCAKSYAIFEWLLFVGSTKIYGMEEIMGIDAVFEN